MARFSNIELLQDTLKPFNFINKLEQVVMTLEVHTHLAIKVSELNISSPFVV